ncbi:MAG: hypothetical protein ACK56I_36835, partial [bacterium]
LEYLKITYFAVLVIKIPPPPLVVPSYIPPAFVHLNFAPKLIKIRMIGLIGLFGLFGLIW